jgi:hypothetical protein
LSAEDDKEALAMAHDMVAGASAVARFDVWQGERRIIGVAPTMREKSPAPMEERAGPQSGLRIERPQTRRSPGPSGNH